MMMTLSWNASITAHIPPTPIDSPQPKYPTANRNRNVQLLYTDSSPKTVAKPGGPCTMYNETVL